MIGEFLGSLTTLFIILFAIGIAIWILTMRRIVPPDYADVVVSKKGSKICSGDESLIKQHEKVNEQINPVYYEIPSWIPVFGVIVRRMPLKIIEITVKDYETFAKGNPRFVVDVSVYCKITNVAEAARRFPGKTMEDFQSSIKQIIISAVRKTTASYTVEDVIAKREEISRVIEQELIPDFEKWGVALTNVAIVDIKDPKDKSSTVVEDISAKKEAEINATSRMEVANRQRDAEIVEAETREKAEKRKIEADEQIAMRDQEKNMKVAEKEQEAAHKEMEVKQVRDVRSAEIGAMASVKTAEGEKKAMAERAEGTRQKFELEGRGSAKKIEYEGFAQADVTKRKMVAEAEGMLEQAKALEYQQEKAYEIISLEVKKLIGLEMAKALQAANIQYIGAGKPESFMEFFTPEGGLNVGGALRALQMTDPEAAAELSKKIKEISNSLTTETGESNSTSEIVKNIVDSANSVDPSKMFRRVTDANKALKRGGRTINAPEESEESTDKDGE